MTLVAIKNLDNAQYPSVAPYHPSEQYPEYPFSNHLSEQINGVYQGVRQLFHLLGYDADNWGNPSWNPLHWLIKPGMTVLLKPNFVQSRHKNGKDLYSIITHPSVLRAVADYCWIALQGQGHLIIADTPQYDCDFDELLHVTHLNEVKDFYNGLEKIKFDILDLRKYWSRGKHFASLLEPLPGDPAGSYIINLGKRSALDNKPGLEKIYGAVYNRSELKAHQHDDVHEYEISKTVLTADVVISIPKMKIHKKVGVTLNAKGLVGICTNRNFLVHYTLTPPSEGGDQYPDNLLTPTESFLIKTERWMYDHFLASRQRLPEYLHRSIYWLHNHTTKLLGIKVDEAKRNLDAGNWYGNDSAWRMTVDLMRSFIFTDTNGDLQITPQRRCFSVIDGIIAGENNGPLTPDPRAAGILIGGENLVAVDIVASRLMGFDPLKLKIYRHLLNDQYFNFGIRALAEIEVIGDPPEYENCLTNDEDRYKNFRPHPGWIGHIEIDSEADSQKHQ